MLSKSSSESTDGSLEGIAFLTVFYFEGFDWYTGIGLLGLGAWGFFETIDFDFIFEMPVPILDFGATAFFGYTKLLTKYFAMFSGCTTIELFFYFSEGPK